MKNILHNLTQARPIALISLLLIGLAPVTWAGTVTTLATGLNNPRGLKFGPDGDLYVAEGGAGGLNSTGTCDQVIPPVGPYTANVTGARISKINRGGLRTTVNDNLPSSQTSPSAGSGVSGVADVAFIGDTLYALLGGAGCSHGVSNIPNGIIRVNANGTYDMVTDLSNYYMTHPVQNPIPPTSNRAVFRIACWPITGLIRDRTKPRRAGPNHSKWPDHQHNRHLRDLRHGLRADGDDRAQWQFHRGQSGVLHRRRRQCPQSYSFREL